MSKSKNCRQYSLSFALSSGNLAYESSPLVWTFTSFLFIKIHFFYQISQVVFSSVSLPPVLRIKGHATLWVLSMLNACRIYKAYFILLPPRNIKNFFRSLLKYRNLSDYRISALSFLEAGEESKVLLIVKAKLCHTEALWGIIQT